MGTQLVKIAPEGLDPDMVARFAELVAPIVERSRGRVTVDRILADHRAERCAIYAVVDGPEVASVVVLRVLDYPSGRRILRIDNAAGRLEDALEHMPQLEAIAQMTECHAMRIEGRKGWARVFPDWEEVATILEKEV